MASETAAPGSCETCGSCDPVMRGGPSIGYACYDEFHDAAASPDDRDLSRWLRELDAGGSVRCLTVRQLRETLDRCAGTAPVATLYDQGADVKFGVTVRGPHACDDECESDCSLAGKVVLDIDPRPES